MLAGVVLVALPRAAPAQEGSWEPRAPLPVPRRLLAAAAHEGRIYTFGGCGSPCFQPPFHTSTFEETLVEVYDPAAEPPWSRRAPMPTIVFGAAAAPVNGRIYVVGGYLTGNLTQEYDPAADTWALKAPMQKPRYGLAVVALGDKVYALGGSGPHGAAVEAYDPETDSWSARAPLPTPRVFLAAAVLGGRIYALGGSPDCCGGSATAVVEVYDPATDAWTAAAPLPVAQQLSAAAAFGGKLYALGGFIPGQGVHGRTFEYDPATGRWTERAPIEHGRDQAPAVALGDCVHVFGGSVHCHCQALDDHRCFRPRRVADLAVAKSDSVVRVCPGQAITYTIRVDNHGPSDVEGARVRDNFPAGLTGVSWSCAPSLGGARCGTPGASGPIDDRVDLPAGGAVTYTVTGTVAPGFCSGRLVNRATVEPPAEVPDQDLSNNVSIDTDTIRRVDVSIEKDDGLEEVTAGEAVTTTITVRNLGGCPTRAQVHDEFPPELSGVIWTCASSCDAVCAGAGTGAIHDLVFLPPDCTLTYTATGVVAGPGGRVSPAAGGTLCNTATVEAECDADEATDCDPIAPCLADLSITAVPSSLAATAGDPVSYGWEVRNHGPQPVAGAIVRAVPPPVFAGAPDWTCSSPGNCDAGAGAGDLVSSVRLDPRDTDTVTFTVEGRLRPDGFCPFVAVAAVDPPRGCADPDPANNRATMDLTVFPPPPGVRACKTVTGELQPGGTVRYRIVLLNPGPFDQGDNQGSELVDFLPPALTMIGAIASSGVVRIEGRTVIWNGEVPAGGTVTIDISATVDGAALAPPLCNRGKLFTDSDGDGDNDEATATDDPRLAGESDPTCLEVLPPLEIPTLPTSGLLALALLLATAGLARLRNRERR